MIATDPFWRGFWHGVFEGNAIGATVLLVVLLAGGAWFWIDCIVLVLSIVGWYGWWVVYDLKLTPGNYFPDHGGDEPVSDSDASASESEQP